MKTPVRSDPAALALVRLALKSGEFRRLREAAHIRRADIALWLGVHETSVLAWERGRSSPTREHAARPASLVDELRSVIKQDAAARSQ
jgi:DNA-binding transcriptional regulator YiaG